MTPSCSKPKIQLLPRYLVDQIKAGEVIERPAAIVKELIENSLDAEAKNIDVQIDDGGLSLISITDDGIGMAQDELPLAFTRHATSKIVKFEDLYQLSSYGFRGEALAGLASVARVICTTIPQNALNSGGKIEFHGGEQVFLGPHQGGAQGTSIFVRDLFFNTPARLKFIRSKKTEVQQIKKILNAFLLTHPEISFTIRWNQQEKELYPVVGADQYQKRLEQILGKKKHQLTILEHQDEFQGHRVHALFMHPNSNQNDEKIISKFQFMFANKRYFNDRKIHYIVTNALHEYLPARDSDFILYMDIPPSELDVNVHPNKTEIKFAGPQIIHALVSGLAKRVGNNQKNIQVSPVDSRNLEHQDFQNWQRGLFADNRGDGPTSVTKDDRPSTQTIFGLPHNIYLYRLPSAETYLVRPFAALAQLLRSRLDKVSFPLSEDSIFPILIGISVSLPRSRVKTLDHAFLTMLNAAGFEAIASPSADPNADFNIILRTFPKFFHGFPLAPLCERFIPLFWELFSKSDNRQADIKTALLQVVDQLSEVNCRSDEASLFIPCPAFVQSFQQGLSSVALDEQVLRGLFEKE